MAKKKRKTRQKKVVAQLAPEAMDLLARIEKHLDILTSSITIAGAGTSAPPAWAPVLYSSSCPETPTQDTPSSQEPA